MLIGREAEQQQISALVAGARVRQSGVLVLSGEAGIGKTALLDDAAELAGDMRVLRVAGSEHESGLGFAGLHQLLAPAAPFIARIPEPQADALSVALMLRSGPPPERFAIGVAALTLLSRYAEESPLLVLIDDAHLLDSPSAEAIRFMARRLVADPIGVLIALRPEPDALLNDAGLPVLVLSGLDLSAATALVTTSTGTPPSAGRITELHRITSGNPLGLVELSGDADQARPSSPEAPVPVPQAVARAFGRRVSALPDSAQRALLVAAVADGELSVTSGAVTALGCDVESLADAEAVGLLTLRAGRAEFRHPLVRAAVYAVADPELRRTAHSAVAAALPAAAVDRRAWHLSEACVGCDDAVADALSEAAQRAASRGAHGAAAAAFARAAELTEQHHIRGQRFTSAGESAWLAGRIRHADDLLNRATELVDDASALATIDGMRGNLALRTGSLRDALELLTRAAHRIEDIDPDGSVVLLADAVTASFYLCDTAAGRATADALEVLLGRCRTAMAKVRGQCAIGIARVLAGDDGVPWIRSAVEALSEEPGRHHDPRRPDWTVIGTLFLRESDAGRELVARIVDEQRSRTALGALPNLLFHAARDDATTDRWAAAVVGFDEGITLARETSQTTDLAASLAGLSWVQARMGLFDECRDNCREALALAEAYHLTVATLWAQYALGDACLAEGDAAGAARQYAELQATMRSIDLHDVDLVPGPELSEALSRLGDVEAARETADDYMAAALQKGQPWALARAHRAVAAVTDDVAERIGLFERALELHQASPDLYEEARTRLAFGASLRRARRKVAARPELRCALEQFERLGARPWANFAATELDATGEQSRRKDDRYLATLTSQEQRIARLLGGGSTTKEAAAALFLSPKTVEYHLRRVYQKLGISSRAELAAALDEFE